MANMWTNELTITGEIEDVRAFAEKAKGDMEEFVLSNFVPMPKALLTKHPHFDHSELDWTLVAEYGHDNWFGWLCRYWGSDRVSAFEKVADEPGKLQYTFDSIDHPLSTAILFIMSQYPTLTFSLNAFGECGSYRAIYAENEVVGAWHDDPRFQACWPVGALPPVRKFNITWPRHDDFDDVGQPLSCMPPELFLWSWERAERDRTVVATDVENGSNYNAQQERIGSSVDEEINMEDDEFLADLKRIGLPS